MEVAKFKMQIFLVWKVVELGLGPGKSWKINQTVARLLTRLLSVKTCYPYIHVVIDLVHICENLICSIS